MKPTLSEARQIAVFFYKSCWAGSILIGSSLFFGISLMLLSQAVFRLAATLLGGVFGWHLILPSFGLFFLRDLERRVPGLAKAIVEFFRNAQPGDYLNVRQLAAQVSARRQRDEA